MGVVVEKKNKHRAIPNLKIKVSSNGRNVRGGNRSGYPVAKGIKPSELQLVPSEITYTKQR